VGRRRWRRLKLFPVASFYPLSGRKGGEFDGKGDEREEKEKKIKKKKKKGKKATV